MKKENALQVFNFQNQKVRVVETDGQTWWVAKDVCNALGLDNGREAIRRLDEDEVSSTDVIDSLGRHQTMTTVNEPGLYSLTLGSRKPQAKAFKRWVTHEVLPSLRKNGFYVNGQEKGDKGKKALLSTLVSLVSKLEKRITLLENSLRGKTENPEIPPRYLVEIPASPFTKIAYYPISKSFDTPSIQFVVDNLNRVDCGEKKKIWEALQKVAVENGWKIGSQSSFYRVCCALTSVFEQETGVRICG